MIQHLKLFDFLSIFLFFKEQNNFDSQLSLFNNINNASANIKHSDSLLSDSLDDPYVAPASPPQLQQATIRPHFQFENKRQLVASASIPNISIKQQSLFTTVATPPIHTPPIVYQRHQKKSQK